MKRENLAFWPSFASFFSYRSVSEISKVYCPMKLTIFTTLFSASLLNGAVLFSLDSSNGFETTIGDGLFLSRNATTGFGNLVIFGGTIASGSFATRGTDETNLQAAIGNGNGGNLMAGDVFTFISNSTGNAFEGEIIYYDFPNRSPIGVIPAEFVLPPDGAAGVTAIFEVSSVPEPSVTLLLGLVSMLSIARRNRL